MLLRECLARTRRQLAPLETTQQSAVAHQRPDFIGLAATFIYARTIYLGHCHSGGDMVCLCLE